MISNQSIKEFSGKCDSILQMIEEDKKPFADIFNEINILNTNRGKIIYNNNELPNLLKLSITTIDNEVNIKYQFVYEKFFNALQKQILEAKGDLARYNALVKLYNDAKQLYGTLHFPENNISNNIITTFEFFQKTIKQNVYNNKCDSILQMIKKDKKSLTEIFKEIKSLNNKKSISRISDYDTTYQLVYRKFFGRLLYELKSKNQSGDHNECDVLIKLYNDAKQQYDEIFPINGNSNNGDIGVIFDGFSNIIMASIPVNISHYPKASIPINISEYPEDIKKLDDNKEKVMVYGDMYANPITLMHCLITDGYATTDKNTYQQLCKVYSNDWGHGPVYENVEADKLRKDKLLKEWEKCIEKIHFVPGSKFILAGDDLGGCGGNDLLILEIYEKAQQDGCTCITILGDHNAYALANKYNKAAKEYNNDYMQHRSTKNYDDMVEHGIITQERRNELVKNVVFPNLKLIDYSIDHALDKKDDKISIIMHTPNSFSIIEQLATYFSLDVKEYKTDNVANTEATIDKINEEFQSLLTNDPKKAEELLEVINDYPHPYTTDNNLIHRMMWNTKPSRDTESSLPSFIEQIIYGHIGEGKAENEPGSKYVNLYSDVGKGQLSDNSAYQVFLVSKFPSSEYLLKNNVYLIIEKDGKICYRDYSGVGYIDYEKSKEILKTIPAATMDKEGKYLPHTGKEVLLGYSGSASHGSTDTTRLIASCLSKTSGHYISVQTTKSQKDIDDHSYVTKMGDKQLIDLCNSSSNKQLAIIAPLLNEKQIVALYESLNNKEHLSTLSTLYVSLTKEQLTNICISGLEQANIDYGTINKYMHEMRSEPGINSDKATTIIKELEKINTTKLIFDLEQLENKAAFTLQDDKLISNIETSIEASKQLIVGCKLALQVAETIKLKDDNEKHRCSVPIWMKFRAVMKEIGLKLIVAISFFKANTPAKKDTLTKVKKGIEAAKAEIDLANNLASNDSKSKKHIEEFQSKLNFNLIYPKI